MRIASQRTGDVSSSVPLSSNVGILPSSIAEQSPFPGNQHARPPPPCVVRCAVGGGNHSDFRVLQFPEPPCILCAASPGCFRQGCAQPLKTYLRGKSGEPQIKRSCSQIQVQASYFEEDQTTFLRKGLDGQDPLTLQVRQPLPQAFAGNPDIRVPKVPAPRMNCQASATGFSSLKPSI